MQILSILNIDQQNKIHNAIQTSHQLFVTGTITVEYILQLPVVTYRERNSSDSFHPISITYVIIETRRYPLSLDCSTVILQLYGKQIEDLMVRLSLGIVSQINERMADQGKGQIAGTAEYRGIQRGDSLVSWYIEGGGVDQVLSISLIVYFIVISFRNVLCMTVLFMLLQSIEVYPRRYNMKV